MSKISPLAFIDPEAKIGENCEIGPFCFIDKNVEIGDNNVLMNSVSVLYGARYRQRQCHFSGGCYQCRASRFEIPGRRHHSRSRR